MKQDPIKWIKKKIPEPIKNGVHYLISRRYRAVRKKIRIAFSKFPEERLSLGQENPDKTFFVIRRMSEVEGLTSILNSVMGNIYYAEKNGYIPVVDMQNYYSQIWQSLEAKGKENAWEYFFQQPAGISLDEIQYSQNVILSNGFDARFKPECMHTLGQKKDVELWHRIFRQYIHLNEKSRLEVHKLMKNYPVQDAKVLGVSLRRGIEWGYLVGNPSYTCYPEPRPFSEILKIIKVKMIEWNCSKIFLVIDDCDTVRVFREEFGEKNIIVMDRNRPTYFQHGEPITMEQYETLNCKGNDFYTAEEKYRREIAFLTEIILLSKCTNVIMGITSANATAMLMNGNKYEHEVILQPNEDKK